MTPCPMPLSDIHILLVEDDEDFRELLIGFLTEEGYRVTGVDTGEGAIQAANERPVDLVIADVKLGGMDGLEALSQIQSHQSELQSLVMTGYSTETDSIRAVKLGVGNYLKKPFTIDDFLKAVEDLAHRITEEREARERELALLDTVAWAFQIVLLAGELENAEEVSNLARQAATRSGLAPTEAAHVRLAVLAALVQRHAEVQETPFLFKGLPTRVTALLQSFEGGASTEQQLVRLAVARTEGRQVDVSEEVREAFQEQDTVVGQSRSLLPLGLALERAGDLDGAQRVFTQLVTGTNRRSEVVGGRLGRARVLFARGEATASLKELEAIIASEKGSVSATEAQLEKGILLARMGKKECAVEALRVSTEAFGGLNHDLGTARSQLALIALGQGNPDQLEQRVNTLLQPRNIETFFASAVWLFPFLLRQKGATVERGLKRYLRDLPGFVSNWMRHARSRKMVQTALNELQKVGVTQYEELLADLAQGSDSEVRKLARHLLSHQSQEAAPPSVRLYALGEFEAFIGDQRVPSARWRGQKSIHFLSFLALRLGEFVSREVLVDHFWPDAGERGFRNLSQMLVVIRKALHPPDWPESFHYIAREGSTLGIDPNVFCWHDVVELQACLERASELPGHDSAQELSRAFELYRGPYLASCYMDWAVEFRRNLELKLLEAGLRLSELRLSQERHAEAAEVAETVLGLDPVCQLAYQRVMQAYIGMGRPEEAVRRFDRYEKVLKNELELEPSTDLIRVYHQAKMAL
jgi:two-component SAPR family response regulator